MFFKCIFVLFLWSVIVDGAFDRPEGKPCRWKEAVGRCINVRRCPSFYYTKDKQEQPPICSFQGKTPIICCVDCDVLSQNETIKDVLDRDHFKTGRKYEEQCLIYEHLLPYNCGQEWKTINIRYFDQKRRCYSSTQTKIPPIPPVEDSFTVDFPHMALLGYGEELESAQWLCGGSLISEKHILTAAHCSSHPQLGPVKYVALGMRKKSNPRHWKKYRVKLFYPHPLYHALSKYHDIAILETELEVNLTEGVRPACLTHKTEFKGDEEAFTSSLTLGPGDKGLMQKMALRKLSAEQCAYQYPARKDLLEGYNHATQVCYEDNHKDSCEIDSGGPLQQRDSSAKYCPYAIIGVTSLACSPPGQARLFTRVSYETFNHVPWIESLIWTD